MPHDRRRPKRTWFVMWKGEEVSDSPNHYNRLLTISILLYKLEVRRPSQEKSQK